MAKFREQLKTKATFYSERVMSSRIYGKDSKKREDPVGKDQQLTRKPVKAKSVGKGSGSSSGKKQKRDDEGDSGRKSKKQKK